MPTFFVPKYLKHDIRSVYKIKREKEVKSNSLPYTKIRELTKYHVSDTRAHIFAEREREEGQREGEGERERYSHTQTTRHNKMLLPPGIHNPVF